MKRALFFLATLLFGVSSSAAPTTDAPPAPPPAETDLLGNIVVVAGATRPLPRVAVVPSFSSDLEDVLLHAVTRRDFDLSGEFELLADDDTPEEALLSSTVDPKHWAKKRVDALVEVSARKIEAQDRVEIMGRIYLATQGPKPVFERRFLVSPDELRPEAHRLVDLLIGALTGTNSAFASRLAFVSGVGTSKRVFTIDADGHGPAAASPPGEIAIAPGFGKTGELVWAASSNHGEYRLRTQSGDPIPLSVRGSVYGFAYSKDKSQVAVSIGGESTIEMFVGPDFQNLKKVAPVGMALRPAFLPDDKVVYSGEGRYGQRIYVEGKPITPDGLFASSPTVCNHPDGIRILFAAGAGKDTDLVMTGERGGDLARLTQHQGRNSYPACSPDGRLVAFFSTRTPGEGPGLYVMRIDGTRAKRISTLLGDSLRWDALPKGHAGDITARQTQSSQ